MDDFYRIKTPRSRQRLPHDMPSRSNKRKPWERTTQKRNPCGVNQPDE